MDAIETVWDGASLYYLRSHWGYKSPEKIADYLGMAKGVVAAQARNMGLESPVSNPDYLTADDLAQVLSTTVGNIRRMIAENVLPYITIFHSGPVNVVHVRQLQLWVADPLNWVYFPFEGVDDCRIESIIKRVAKEWGDRWLTVIEAANIRHVSRGLIYHYIYEGRVQALKWGGKWMLLRSVVERTPFAHDTVASVYCGGCGKWFEVSSSSHKKLLFGDDLIVAPVDVVLACSVCGRARRGPFTVKGRFVEQPQKEGISRSPSIISVYCSGCSTWTGVDSHLHKNLLLGEDMIVAPVGAVIPCSFCGKARIGPFYANARLIE